MAATVSVSFESTTMNGGKFVQGFLSLGTTNSDGYAAVDLSDYLRADGSPLVIVQSCGVSGACYTIQHNQGTAEDGAVNVVHSTNGEAEKSTDLSATNIPFIAFGPAY